MSPFRALLIRVVSKAGSGVLVAALMTAATGALAQSAHTNAATTVAPSGDTLAVRLARSAREADEAAAELRRIADREDMVRIRMRDGAFLNATLLFQKGQPRVSLPTILIFFPYNIDEVMKWPFVRLFISHGYAVAAVTTRGRYFSDGVYTFLGGVGRDSNDTINWLASQGWSNGKVGAYGCSSSAEEQHKMNAMLNPHFAAAVLMSSGAGIGKVGPYNEMGSFYRGGAVQNLWFTWYPTAGYRFKPQFPGNLSRAEMLRLAPFWKIEPNVAPQPISLDDPVLRTLPENRILARMQALPSDLDDFINRLPNDPRWDAVEFGREGDRNGAPALYINAWYDHSVQANLAMYEYQRSNAATAAARDNAFVIVAPTEHCLQATATERTVVGERDMGDARFDYESFILRWYDRWLKGVDNGIEHEPRVRAYLMGRNRWRTYDTWPPRQTRPVTYYLDSGGNANTRKGDGRLTTTVPTRAGTDRYIYDPMDPRPSRGGQAFPWETSGAVDQSDIEMRQDCLVYTTPPLREAIEVTGAIQATLYLSSDAKDTDLMVKLVDVHPDGRAFNLDETVLRVRWREGYAQPVFMRPGAVYEVSLPPLVTSNAFLPGHRIRVEVSSSAFPMLERNLNTGGNNFDEAFGVVAHNTIHHSREHRSRIVLPLSKYTGGK